MERMASTVLQFQHVSVVRDGNAILDVHGWQIADPVAMERDLNQIAGVVTVGLFAQRPADVVLIGDREM